MTDNNVGFGVSGGEETRKSLLFLVKLLYLMMDNKTKNKITTKSLAIN
ncbi:hypothetical protein MUB16_22665 [Priestia sp. OVL9]|nr:hypothetical protein [Priestia sp. OVL9]